MALALKPRPFTNNVCLRPPATMYELKLHVADYIRMGEMKTLGTRFYTEFHPGDQKIDKLPPKADSRPREPRPPPPAFRDMPR